MPTLTLAAEALGRPLATAVMLAIIGALVLVGLRLAGLVDLDPSVLDEVGSWRWMPDA